MTHRLPTSPQRAASHALTTCLALVAWAAVAHAQVPSARATASSEWGPGYGAAAAADGLAGAEGNYWQTVAGMDKGAWWQEDLGQVATVQAVRISWAHAEDRTHCPPARITVQTSLTGDDGSWREVKAVGPDDIPRDGDPYEAGRAWRYPLGAETKARWLRLAFPDGCQPGAKYPGYLCLGEVEVQAPELVPRMASIEGRFGKADFSLSAPSLVRLYLRGSQGLPEQSLLATAGRRPWARLGYTYVVGQDGRRYESYLTGPGNAEVSRRGGATELRVSGVRLSADPDDEPVALEDWVISAPANGSELVWRITRRWQRDMQVSCSGMPGLFFSFDARRLPNSVTSTLWHDPLRIAAGPSDLYRLQNMPGRVSENHLQTLRDPNTWAIYKLWTNWHAPVDLRLTVRGGNLYRRGSFAWLSEAGATTPADGQHRSEGDVEEIVLRIGAEDKAATGYQLAVKLPDEATQSALTDFYGSVLNGGAVNDQKGFDFGNESDGWYYAGSNWMYGVALSAGVPAPGALSPHPYDAASAFREHLVHVLSVVDDQGRAHFGYNQGGEWVDDNLHTIIGARLYLLHTGDLPFVRRHLPVLERMLGYFIRRRDAQGLFRLDDVGAHWYYDAISTSGVNGYHNAFFYKAACDLAEMEAAAGYGRKAGRYRDLAAGLKAAFNAVLWEDDAPGGPRYADWIDAEGRPISYFCDLCQWPAVAVGLASPEQARKIVATADARLRDLETEHGYRGFAGLSALWPVPQELNPYEWQSFGTYMNGGSLLCQTYWEIVARARAGDAEGAARRLRLFARRASETSWAGDNAANMAGEMRSGDGEPYLADMVAASAALIHGVLGINPTWERLEVSPCLPADWRRAQADVLYKGRRHRVTVDDGHVEVKALDQVIKPTLSWLMDANLRRSPEGVARQSGVSLGDGSSLSLGRVFDDGGALGLWKLDDASAPALDGTLHERNGSLAGAGIAFGEPGHATGSKCCRFDGGGTLTVADGGALAFGPEDSFTVQCWFRTDAQDSHVMVGKSGAWCVYVKAGKLAAWLMEDGQAFREALGSHPASDGLWHHVAAVSDRETQRLSLYLDGKLDTPDGAPGALNPVDISPLGGSTSRGAVTIGGLDGGFPFSGLIDEVSIFRGALKPGDFALASDYPATIGSAEVHFAPAGSYLSPACDWTVSARPTRLDVAAELRGGRVTATVEASDDGFRTVSARARIRVRSGFRSYSLKALKESSRAVRVKFDLAPAERGLATPVVDGFRVTAEEAGN